MPDYLLPSSQFPGRTVLASSFLPLDYVSCCPRCGTVVGTEVEGRVTLHVIDPDWTAITEEGFGMRPPLPPRSLSQDSRHASCPYCGSELDVDSVVQRDPEDFLTLKM